MNFFGMNEYELLIIIVLGLFLLGPERLPEYASKLAKFVKSLRAYAEGAKAQLKDQMGPEFDQVDWNAYDPRRYDPRKIVREALSDVDDALRSPGPGGGGAAGAASAGAASAGAGQIGGAASGSAASGSAAMGGSLGASPVRHDPQAPTPWDVDAT